MGPPFRQTGIDALLGAVANVAKPREIIEKKTTGTSNHMDPGAPKHKCTFWGRF